MKLFIECVENLKHVFCGGIKLNPKLVGTDIETTIIEILNIHNKSEYKNEKEYVEKFKTLFVDFFEIDFKFNNEKKKFKTSLSLKEQDDFFIIHYNSYFSDIDAVIILFLINQQSRKMVGKFINQGTDLSEKNEDYGVVFPLIIMQPSVKFERMKSQEGAFLYQTPHYRGNTDDFIGFTSINSDIIYNKKQKEYNDELRKIGNQ